MGRFITADPTIQHSYDPQNFNRYSYCRNNPVNYTDPTGHSWLSKLLGAIFGFIVGAITSIFAGPQIGFAVGMATFNAIDAGISASQAGLNGWKVAGIALASAVSSFVGSQIGSAFGGWAGGGAFGEAVFGCMFAGAAGGATDAALSGGNVVQSALWGGAIGTAMGILQGGLFATPAYADEDNSKVLDLADDPKVKIGERPLESLWGRLLEIGHKFIMFEDGRIVEMGPLNGTIHVYDSLNLDEITAGTTRYLTQLPGNIKWTTADISSSMFEKALSVYKSTWVGTPYNALNHNSNYFVNSVITASGGTINSGGYYCPGFPDKDK